MSKNDTTTLPEGVRLAGSITKLPPDSPGTVVICGSHGGRYLGYLAVSAGLRGVVLNDAGVGLDAAGIGSLPYLDDFAIAAATVDSALCRIGDPDDMLRRGVISHANETAQAVGVAAGLDALEAATRMLAATPNGRRAEPVSEGRTVLGAGKRPIVLIDSAALVEPGDAGAIVVTGSHGGLVGGQPHMALQVDGFAAVFNDAGIGPENAGISRLPALEARGIAAFTVSCASARIGSARSSYADGVISALNAVAAGHGARLGDRARDVLDRWATL